MDNVTTIADLQQRAIEFRDRRNWKQFHDLKNLAMGLSIEAAELQELFLWKNGGEIDALLSSDEGCRKVRHELADVFVFLLYLGAAAGVDLAAAVIEKIGINEEKYPVEKSYNSSRKYDEL